MTQRNAEVTDGREDRGVAMRSRAKDDVVPEPARAATRQIAVIVGVERLRNDPSVSTHDDSSASEIRSLHVGGDAIHEHRVVHLGEGAVKVV